MYRCGPMVDICRGPHIPNTSHVIQDEKQEFGLKPMNCPVHYLMFEHRGKSYKGN